MIRRLGSLEPKRLFCYLLLLSKFRLLPSLKHPPLNDLIGNYREDPRLPSIIDTVNKFLLYKSIAPYTGCP